MDKNKFDKSTEQKILESARNIFHRKGLEGARMQEIADEAGINKAMLHYYFRSKDQLFDSVFMEAVKIIFPKIKELLNVELPLFEKIRFFTDNYLTILMDNMYLPVFVINEINRNPKRFIKSITDKVNLTPEVFLAQINKAVKEKLIKPVDPKQLFINLMSMCIFPVLAKPMLMQIYGLDEKGYARFLGKRKTEIPEFIIDSIKLKK